MAFLHRKHGKCKNSSLLWNSCTLSFILYYLYKFHLHGIDAINAVYDNADAPWGWSDGKSFISTYIALNSRMHFRIMRCIMRLFGCWVYPCLTKLVSWGFWLSSRCGQGLISAFVQFPDPCTLYTLFAYIRFAMVHILRVSGFIKIADIDLVPARAIFAVGSCSRSWYYPFSAEIKKKMIRCMNCSCWE